MQGYFLKSLLGFVLVIATSDLASARLPSYFLFPKDAEVAEQQANVETNVDSLNELSDTQQENAENSAQPEPYLNVELSNNVGHKVTIREGASYELTCNISIRNMYQEPEVSWVHGHSAMEKLSLRVKKLRTNTSSNLLSSEKGQLVAFRGQLKHVIHCASQQDAGHIYCAAIVNDKLGFASTEIAVTANRSGSRSCETKNPPVITYHKSTIMSPQGSTVMLPCEVRRRQNIEISWYSSSWEQISNDHDSRYTIFDNGTLMIEDLNFDADMGPVVCVAESKSGVDEATTFVYPLLESDKRK